MPNTYNGSYKSSVRAVISSLGIRKKLVGPVRVSNLEKEIEQSQLKLGFAEGPPWHISLCPDLQSIGQTTFDNKLLTRSIKVTSVISVSGIQYRRICDYMGDHQRIHRRDDNLYLLIYTHVATEFCQLCTETLWDGK
ncbi:hypothetical protein ALC53_01897 [Atta colombica]|uniref:Uncharacterized protein n=1 Tax=Atta colombica TaxID=520822 RepID=A0A195BRF5_9HYME|nr:hypothetical protein ALC53_01897 [Atta colombica]